MRNATLLPSLAQRVVGPRIATLHVLHENWDTTDWIELDKLIIVLFEIMTLRKLLRQRGSTSLSTWLAKRIKSHTTNFRIVGSNGKQTEIGY